MIKTLLPAAVAAALSFQATPPPAAPAPQPPAEPPPAAVLHADFATAKGKFSILLHTAEAPTACANFINLAKRGYYANQPVAGWTRVIRQVEGPIGVASAGYLIRREFSAKLRFDRPGRVALQRATGSDQAHPTIFFITVKEQDRWDLDLPIFATVDAGQEVVDALQQNDVIQSIAIRGDAAELLKKYEADIVKWNAALEKKLKEKAEEPTKPEEKAPPRA